MIACLSCGRSEYSGSSAPVVGDLDDPAEPRSSELLCRREDADAGSADALNILLGSLPGAGEPTPFRCLRFLAADDLGRDHDATIVDIRAENPDDAAAYGRRLRMPLHEIKTKGFLRDRRVAILSDGTRYAALEEECPDIKASGVAGVFAILAGRQEAPPNAQPSSLVAATMTPQEFIAERRYGIWHIVDFSREGRGEPLLLQSEGTTAQHENSAERGSAVRLERTLVVFDDKTSIDLDEVTEGHRLVGQVFVLEDGLAGLKRYRSEAAAMAVALAGPRIDERGCSQ